MPTSSTKTEPIVGVVIPCHNHVDYIAGAMNTVARQEYPHKQLVVVDDASTDESWEMMSDALDSKVSSGMDANGNIVTTGEYCGLPVTLVQLRENHKQAYARNIGIQVLWDKVDLFAFLYADDEYYTTKLGRLVDAYQMDPMNIGIVYNDTTIMDVRGETHSFLHECRVPYDRVQLESSNIIGNSPLVSKMALGYSGLFDVDLPPCEDWDLWLRITENFVAVHVPEELHVYRVTDQSCTFTVDNAVWNMQRRKIFEKMQQRKAQR